MTQITRKPSLTQYLRKANPDLVTYDEARQAWYDYRADHGYRTTRCAYLSVGDHNKKIAKNRIPSVSFTGAPHRMAGLNACTNSTASCRKVCIRHTGRLEMPRAQEVGVDRMQFLHQNPDHAISLIHWETVRAAAKVSELARRLNVVTDLNWEDIAPWLFTHAPENVVTYDYTKDWSRQPEPAERYRLTFSAMERHGAAEIIQMTNKGRNVAVVFPAEYKDTPYPDEWFGIPLINGDVTDFRYEDPQTGVIVALYAKGRARRMPIGMDCFVKPVVGPWAPGPSGLAC